MLALYTNCITQFTVSYFETRHGNTYFYLSTMSFKDLFNTGATLITVSKCKRTVYRIHYTLRDHLLPPPLNQPLYWHFNSKLMLALTIVLAFVSI